MRTNCAAEAGNHAAVPSAHKVSPAANRHGDNIKAHTVQYIDVDKLGVFVQRDNFPPAN